MKNLEVLKEFLQGDLVDNKVGRILLCSWESGIHKDLVDVDGMVEMVRGFEVGLALSKWEMERIYLSSLVLSLH